jgi:hypothetical protein
LMGIHQSLLIEYVQEGQRLEQISELTWTRHCAEQAASTHEPQHLNVKEDERPATQPVYSLLLKGQYKDR